MSLPDATIDLNLPSDHSDHLVEGENILLNVNAFRPLDNVHIRLGTARMDNLPKIRSNTTHSQAFEVPDYIGTNTIGLFDENGLSVSNKLEIVIAPKMLDLSLIHI